MVSGTLLHAVWMLDHAKAAPVFRRNGKYISAAGQSFREFMEGRLPALPGEFPTKKDWEDHLTTIFPEVGCRFACSSPRGELNPPRLL